MQPYRILVPTDFSPSADAALRQAISIAKSKEAAEVVLLHVSSSLVPLMDEELGVLEPERLMALMKMRAAEYATRTDVAFREVFLHGNPSDVIVDFAADEDAAMIVMGTHGRKGWDRYVLGSVAEAVLRNAECPVLVVKGKVAENDAGKQPTGTGVERESRPPLGGAKP